ncbi:hypothetical protein BC936DRAFT_146976 [Jimgerdemannia flammicorona]|uniref:Uncharacterized protein n=2 Tax=Jimgerdemannia flammicorona TaxID=994334 RepID=A0A433DL64_9FUNG|nr:hypothetical protein BC936DRAFT_146976 [Jimgerdemannia flammicorona]RUS29616.1 hypothetical protein BC938DRAFT_480448 [Jimgerdemannia flammicorona]
MADEENFDIYGDDNFGGVDQHDDIFDEIVGNDNDNRPAKRRRDDNGGDYGGGDDDLFDDFGDIDKDYGDDGNLGETPMKSDHVEEEYNARHQPSGNNSNNSQQQRLQQQHPQQNYNQGTQHQQRDMSEQVAATSKREASTNMSSLRGNTSNATNALYIGELTWWTTDEDIKAIATEAGVGHELRDVTFYEHKVNGKSRGVAYAEFNTVDAAAKTKELLDDTEVNGKKCLVNFTSVNNPFRTIPKEPPPKAQRLGQQGNTTITNVGRGQTPMGNARGAANLPVNPAAAAVMRQGAGFNPMMAAAAGRGFPGMPPRDFFPGGGMMGPMGFGGFPNPAAAAAAAGRGGYMNGFGGADGFGADPMAAMRGGAGAGAGLRGGMMGMQGGRGGGRGGAAMGVRGGAAAGFMGRGGGRGGAGYGMMGGGGDEFMGGGGGFGGGGNNNSAGFPGMHINPAFFDQQGGGYGGGMGGGMGGMGEDQVPTGPRAGPGAGRFDEFGRQTGAVGMNPLKRGRIDEDDMDQRGGRY